MTFSVVTTEGGHFIIPLLKREFYHPPFGKGRFYRPPLEKGGEGGLEKAYKISPDPSLLKRGTKAELC
jgi:hypothetical protein